LGWQSWRSTNQEIWQETVSTRETRLGSVVGTVAYVSPERAPRLSVARTDLFSAGTILYEMAQREAGIRRAESGGDFLAPSLPQRRGHEQFFEQGAAGTRTNHPQGTGEEYP
jgi:serine/threonine protein kinase